MSLTDRWPLLEQEWAGNSLLAWLYVGVLIFALAFTFRILIPLLLSRLQLLTIKSTSTVDDALVAIVLGIPKWIFNILALCIGASLLNLPAVAHTVLEACILVTLTYITITVAQQVIESLLLEKVPRFKKSKRKSLPAVLRVVMMLALWVFGLLLILSNLGINVVSLVTGLGIGGIAIALAVQNILGDILSSFALYMDKPFVEGDFIVVGDKMGVVQYIGLKTTRLQALQGEQIVISNQELTGSRIQNFKQMHERRVVCRIGVTYDATPKQLRAASGIAQEVIDAQPKARFDRAHFAGFGESSLDIEIVYYILSPDYNLYMDIQQDINLALYERLQKAGLSFAFPTRTVYLAK